jgi:hypothetical protein
VAGSRCGSCAPSREARRGALRARDPGSARPVPQVPAVDVLGLVDAAPAGKPRHGARRAKPAFHFSRGGPGPNGWPMSRSRPPSRRPKAQLVSEL